MGKAVWLSGPDRATTRFGEPAKYREGLYRLTERTYAWMVPNGAWGEANFGLIDCGGKSVVIDTGWDLKYTREFLRGASEVLTHSPVHSVINTHSDGDHCWGNQLFEGLPIFATHACIRQMRRLEPGSLRLLAKASRVMKALPIAGIDVLGHYAGAMIAPYDFSGIRLTEPNQGFSSEATVSVNGMDLVLQEVGPAHSPGDAMVYVPSDNVVYAGDIVFSGCTPVIWAGPVANIMAGLSKVLALDADFIVPGHGPVATRLDVELQVSYWDTIQEGLHRRCRQGMSPLRAAADLLLSPPFRSSPFAHWDSPERLFRNAQALYQEWGHRPLPLPDSLAKLDTLRQQGILALMQPDATPRCMHRR